MPCVLCADTPRRRSSAEMPTPRQILRTEPVACRMTAAAAGFAHEPIPDEQTQTTDHSHLAIASFYTFDCPSPDASVSVRLAPEVHPVCKAIPVLLDFVQQDRSSLGLPSSQSSSAVAIAKTERRYLYAAIMTSRWSSPIGEKPQLL